MKRFLKRLSIAIVSVLLSLISFAPLAAHAYYECHYWEDSGYNECWWVEDYPPAPVATPVPCYYNEYGGCYYLAG